jgi:hypothetical protein
MEAVRLAGAKSLPQEVLGMIKAFVGPGGRGFPTPTATIITEAIRSNRELIAINRSGGFLTMQLMPYDAAEAVIVQWHIAPGRGFTRYLAWHFDQEWSEESTFYHHRKLGHGFRMFSIGGGVFQESDGSVGTYPGLTW